MSDTDHPDSGTITVKSTRLATLEGFLLAHGLETWAPIDGETLARGLDSGLPTGPEAMQMARQATLQANGQACVQAVSSGARGAIAVALPYDPRPAVGIGDTDLSGGPAPYLRVGAFASAHRYAALARLLKAVAKKLAAVTGHPYASFRVAVNSRLPEKRLVELSGLGCRGRSDLLLTYAYGPACILGVLLLPFDPLEATEPDHIWGNDAGTAPLSPCGTCRACADACPGRAIVGDAECCTSFSVPGSSQTYHRESCIQHWMSTMDEPPQALRPAFAGRLYGCDACILACPLSVRAWQPDRSDGSSPASRADALLLPGERRPGSLVSAPFLARADDAELKAFFRKTALGLSWFGPGMLRHNAALAGSDRGRGGSAGI
ncbi:MAG: 4Fe-4S double cluster binding domain-containing protein [Clostridia bacterium]